MKSRMKCKTKCWAVLLVVLGLLAGCMGIGGGTGCVIGNGGGTTYGMGCYWGIEFDDYPVFTELPETVKGKMNVKQVVELGLALGDLGEHHKAAEVFLKGARSFESKDARLEQAFISAAIFEHFKAGEISMVREDFKKLDDLRTSPYKWRWYYGLC